ncbi:MAG: ATP-dependent DNA helicase [Thermodesulfobacteriota bacterium]|nr:ATP-dependent DNA helicase [Thermodesulfobacteriota bacterium]
MITISDPIQEIIGPDGSLARTLDVFEFRPSQIKMAHLIDEAIKKKTPVIIEAGTGTGKTLGYLVPLVLSGKKCVISTGTKNLQEQVFFKDIPLLSEVKGIKIDAMLMKGRRNYLCLYRYHQFFSHPSLFKQDHEKIRKKIEQWMNKTIFADRAELPWMRDDDSLWDAISSTSEQCLGSDCPHMEDCYLNALRRTAARSQIIIVNHHLFFADLMVKKGGFGEIIPRFQVVIFDEAHNTEEIATTYFGERLSTLQLMDLVSEIEKETGEAKDKGIHNLKKHLDLIRTGAQHIRELFNDSGDKGRLNQETLRIIHNGPGTYIMQGLEYIMEKSELITSKKVSFQAFAARAGELDQLLKKILSFHNPNLLSWYERRKRGVVLHASPLDISADMDKLLYQKVKTIGFTSATLSTNGNFNYFRSRLGLGDNVLEGIYPSHFDFKRQTLMYVPRDLPLPNDTDFAYKIAGRILEILKITSGRALVLFTSYQNLNLVHYHLDGKLSYTLYKQGDAPRSLLLEEFKRDTHSVLLATGSFWQGVDVPGEALSCLIIDKLPFDSPGEPLISARIELIKSGGGNPFLEYQVPSAIISLKQGLGRLIRNASDRGILSILDTRLISSRYGHFFFNSLPEIPISHELFDVDQFFNQAS